jgi:UDP-glucose 4-epimerase
MNWLITGGCGFIGTSLIRALLKDDSNQIRVIDNLSVGSKIDLSCVHVFSDLAVADITMDFSRLELVEGDIMDSELALLVTKGCDAIVHLAANTGVGPSVESPRDDMMVNVIGTFNYLDAARINKINRFVFASSGAPAGEVEPPIHEELPPHPVSPYGASKLSGEGYCSAFYRSFNVEAVALRFGNVYGPGSIHKASVVAKFIKQALNGEILEVYGDGSQTRDFIFIDDLVKAVILAATLPAIGGEVFQIATSKEISVGEMVEKLLDLLRARGVADVKLINRELRVGDVQRNFSDTSKALAMLGWKHSVELGEGLDKTIDYFLINVREGR